MTIESAGVTLSGATEGVTITALGSANAKGSAVDLLASTARDTYGLWLTFATKSAGARYAVDILFGATVKIPNIIFGSSGAVNIESAGVFIPLVIPAGTQLRAACQCSSSSATMYVSAHLDSGAPPPQSGGTTYQACGVTVSGATTGTTLTVPASNNTPTTTYDTLLASTTGDINCIFIAVYGAANTATARNAISIAKGAASSETDVIPPFLVTENGTADFPLPYFLGPFFVPTIASGSRISARYQTSDITQSAPRIVVYGTDYLPFTSGGGSNVAANKFIGKAF